VAGIFVKRTELVSGGPSAASDLPEARNPPRPAAPANAAWARNRRRLWLDIEHLPNPNGWTTMSLARWPIRAVQIGVVGRAGVFPGLIMMIGRCTFAVECRGPSTADPQSCPCGNSRIALPAVLKR